MNIINNQWAAFNAQKEQEKLERVSNKLKLQIEHVLLKLTDLKYIQRAVASWPT